jgi:hypothetical protein
LLIVNIPRREVGWFTTERSTISFAKANDDKSEPSTVQGHGGILTIHGCVGLRLSGE